MSCINPAGERERERERERAEHATRMPLYCYLAKGTYIV